MRIPVLEDRDSFLTRMKYYFEPAANAQKRFDCWKKKWGGTELFRPFRNGGYYIIQIRTGMFPMPPPVWFARKNLRQDQIAYLEEVIKKPGIQKDR